jgi:hypothetical protein
MRTGGGSNGLATARPVEGQTGAAVLGNGLQARALSRNEVLPRARRGDAQSRHRPEPVCGYRDRHGRRECRNSPRSGGRLCIRHWEIAQRYKPAAMRAREERRRRKLERERQAEERAAKREAARAADAREGRRRRRAAHGALSRAEADAAKRAICGESVKQRAARGDLGCSRASYYRQRQLCRQDELR